MPSAMGVLFPLTTMGRMGASAVMGWFGHFMIGMLAWGGGFVLLYHRVPGDTALVKGIGVGVAVWLGMMVMPMAYGGPFGMAFGMMTRVLHIVFGVVLGTVFYLLVEPKAAFH